MNPSARRALLAVLVLSAAASAAAAPPRAAKPAEKPAPAPASSSVPPTDVLAGLAFRSIGPAIMGGRIDDFAVVESRPSTFYVATAAGGLWKTVNNGVTLEPVFDDQEVSSIGDVAVAPSDPSIVYVGTGEPNNRQSSSWGNGVYKSLDAGKTWIHLGLADTHHIGRVVVHPTSPDVVYVAALGHLWGPSKERGLFRTTDGGKTWVNTKFVDEDTGFVDVAMDPESPQTLYAASYQRRRTPFGYNGGGPGSALWKTTNGGETWTRLTEGLPSQGDVGRIGIGIHRRDPRIVYALVEHAKEGGIYRSEDKGATWKKMSDTNPRPSYYSKVHVDPGNDQRVWVLGAPLFLSEDGGKTFRQDVGQKIHGDYHALWIDPADSNHMLAGTDGGLHITYDRARSWDYVNTVPLAQFYEISFDLQRPYRVCGGLQDNGSWCGPSGVRSTTGILNSDWFRVGGGDGFYTANDASDWRVLYSESQDGNTNRIELPGRTVSIRPRPTATGGRGGAAAAAPANTETPVAPPSFGAAAGPNVVPTPPSGTSYRFYWSTPFILSPHNPRTIYLGGDRLFRSYDRGDTWTASPDLTNNIGRNDRPIMSVAGAAPMASKHDGAASYSNIITISESSVVPGVLWVGTNDGNVQVSRDGGATWKNVVGNVKGVPKETHVSRVEASHHDGSTAYVSFDGHRTDDHKPYIFVTKDLGETWTSVSGNLPEGNVNVIREDPKNRNLLYAGTEYAFFISLNGGREWKPFMTGLPYVRIDDVMVHPRDNDLILGTHGRSIWVMDDISALQQLSDDSMKTDEQVLDIRPAIAWTNDIQRAILAEGAKHFRGQNPPRGTAISYWFKSAPSADVRITITDITGREIRSLEGTKEAGLNRVAWDLTLSGAGRGGRGAGRGAAVAGQEQAGQPPAQGAQPQRGAGGGGGGGRAGLAATVPPGSYLVKVMVGDRAIGQKTLVVEADTLQ